jgi:hypothetical protein
MFYVPCISPSRSGAFFRDSRAKWGYEFSIQQYRADWPPEHNRSLDSVKIRFVYSSNAVLYFNTILKNIIYV